MRHADLVVLGILSPAPRHGYDLVREIETMRVRNWAQVAPATIYRTVQRLTAQGYLRSVAEREGRRPERRVYQITKPGRKRLAELVRAAVASEEPLYSDRLVGGVFALAAVKREEAEALLEGVIRQLRERRARLDAALSTRVHPVGEAILRFSQKLVAAEEEFIADLLRGHVSQGETNQHRLPDVKG
jgi:DNA-binding PadR family transcriptional regulator